jgi:hypothetical protein
LPERYGPDTLPDVLHWAMRPASYHHIHMVIKIASNLPEFCHSFTSSIVNHVALCECMLHGFASQ